jgi:hypothetical protein
MPDPITDPRNPGKSATDARQGRTLGTMRWVLAISVVLAVIAMVVVFMMTR